MAGDGTPYYKDVPFMHEAGTPNGIGAVTFAEAHKVLYGEIGEAGLRKHTLELTSAMKACSAGLKEAGYDVWFCDDTCGRTPIMIIDNKVRSNAETVRMLNNPPEGGKAVFVREGAFCAYRIIEKIKPGLKDISRKITEAGVLDERYSLIRLSAGLVNTENDIFEASERPKEINRS